MTINQHYKWKRFWCPRGGSILLTQEGYLNDLGKYNKGIVTFDSIMDVPCLVLLGEPGMGKSNVLKSEWQHSIASIEKDGNKTLPIDLRSFGSEDRLVGSIFGCKEFIEWVNGNHHLHIFLDSLDECLLRIDTVATLLVDELKKYPVQRLSLRIACRSAEWPAVLETGLRELWSNTAIGIYELAPLRKQDVTEAARTEGIEATELFLEEITRKNAGPLAAKPVTLKLLINLWLKNQHLPETQAELYEQGCLLLCEEESQSRIAARRKGELTPTERMVVAARLAAITVFANRFAIWIDVDRGNCPEEDITVRELCGYTEHATVESFAITEEAVRETIEVTGLFSLRGTSRLGWVHQTYAEFLAAWYLKHLKLDATKVISLITHPEDPEGKIAPQLQEASAWVAGMMPDVFTHLMKTDTMVLLRSDVAAADNYTKSQLTSALLKAFAEERELDNWELRHQYSKLKHPDLAAQLRPYIINDKNQGFIVRRAAIDIAEECQVKELQKELADVALSIDEELPIRIQAASAISKIGDREQRSRLLPLTTQHIQGDEDGELRGYSLSAVWPENISAEQLFSDLPEPSDFFSGAYKRFLSRHLLQHIIPSDLPYALAWVKKLGSRHHLSFSVRDVVDHILVMAWRNLDEPGVFDAFSEVVFQRLKAHEDIVESRNSREHLQELNDDAKRHRVLKKVFSYVQNPNDEWFWFADYHTLSVSFQDLHWLLQCLLASDQQPEQILLARLIDRVLGYRELHPDVLSAIQKFCEFHSILNEILAPRFQAIELNSPEATRMREQEKWLNASQEPKEEQTTLLEPPPAERIEQLLVKFENGDCNAWWRLNMEMTLEPHSTHYGSDFETDLMQLPGWVSSDKQTRQRIISAAKKYLLQGEPNTSHWQGTNIVYRPAIAGYRALFFLFQTEMDFLLSIADSIWQKWIPIIVSPLTSSGENSEEALHEKIAVLAYQKAPDAVIQCLLRGFENSNPDADHLRVPQKFNDCWNARMKDTLRTKLQESELKVEIFRNLLNQLLEHGDDQTRIYAEQWFDSHSLANNEQRKLALITARALMRHCPQTSWSRIWPLVQQYTDFGRELFESLADEPGKLSVELPETAQSDLYIWLARQYPHREDPNTRGAHFIGTRESVGRWRDSILNQLKGLGTPQSLIAIENIQRELPELDWLKWVLNETKDNLRRHTWIPLQPQQIIFLGQTESLPRNQEQVASPMNTEKSSRANLFWNSKQIGETPALMEFLDLYKNNPDRVVPFVGAGLSLPLFPAWKELLKSLVRKCTDLGKLGYDPDELLENIEHEKDFLDIAECCVAALGQTGYRDFIQKNYDREITYEMIPIAYQELLSLNLRTILTTNYDRIPEVGGKGEYRTFTHQNAAEARRARVENKKVVMKLHGDITRHDSIILTRDDYDQIIFKPSDIKQFLQEVFGTKTMLFIGFGLSDPHLEQILLGLKETSSGIPLTHYALISGLTRFQADTKERNFGIKIIRYEPSDLTHPEVLEFIRLLAQY